jgi:hypothetical protein
MRFLIHICLKIFQFLLYVQFSTDYIGTDFLVLFYI